MAAQADNLRPLLEALMAGQQMPDAQLQTVGSDGMMYAQHPTIDAAKQHLLELQGQGYNGYVVPLGNATNGHEVRAWKSK